MPLAHTDRAHPAGESKQPLTFGMHLELSAQRTNLTCPRDFGGLLRPVARLFLVISGWLGVLAVLSEPPRPIESPAENRY